MFTRVSRIHAMKAGLPPGTLVHAGRKSDKPVKITVLDYNKDEFEEKSVAAIEECFPYRDKASVTWINIDGVHDLALMEKLGQRFGLHPLVLEDVVNTDQRPKLEEFENYLFIALKMIRHDTGTHEHVAQQVSLVVGTNFVISFQEAENDVFEPIRQRLRTAKGRIRALGSDYLAYALIDIVIDNYFTVLETCAEKIEVLEDHASSGLASGSLRGIHSIRKQMIHLRKSIWPLREVLGNLGRCDCALITPGTSPYLRDAYDHVVQLIDAIESFREMVTSLRDIYLSGISNRTNEVMKVLTVIATIFIPLTFVAGIYGMNFKNMPELEWKWGYAVVLGIMAGIALLMLVYFRRKKWF